MKKSKDEKKKGFRISGHYPGRDWTETLYTPDSMYGELAPDQVNMKIISSKAPLQWDVDYADFSTSGHLSAFWDDSTKDPPIPTSQRHDGFELQYVMSGTLSIRIEQTAITLREGDCVFVDQNVQETMSEFEPGTAIVTILLTHSFLKKYYEKNRRFSITPPLFRDFISLSVNAPTHSRSDYLFFQNTGTPVHELESCQLLNILFQELQEKKPGYDRVVSGLLLRLFSSLLEVPDYQFEKHSINPQTEEELTLEIKNYLEQNPRRVTLKELSDHFFFSEGYLSLIFRNNMGISITNYEKTILSKEAVKLLTETDMTIEQIAQKLGFSGRAQFYRNFQTAYQTSPGAYRKEHIRAKEKTDS